MRRPRIPGRLPNLAGSAVHFARVKRALEGSLNAPANRSADPAAEARREIADSFASGLEPARTMLERHIREKAVAAARAAGRGQPNAQVEQELDTLLRLYTRQP